MMSLKSRIIILMVVEAILLVAGCVEKDTTQANATPAPVHVNELTLINSQGIDPSGSDHGAIGFVYIYHDNLNNGTVYVFTGADNLVVGGAAIPAQQTGA